MTDDAFLQELTSNHPTSDELSAPHSDAAASHSEGEQGAEEYGEEE